MLRTTSILLLLLLLAGCADSPPPEQVIARAVVGAREASLMKELGARPEPSGTVRFGDSVEILARRRVFLLVRGPRGATGWIDSRQLVRDEDIRNLRQLASEYRDTPAIGRARIFESLNVHTIPNRQSPSFEQIAAGETVDVLGHRVAERAPYRPTLPDQEAIAAKKRAAAQRKLPKRKKKEPELPPPPPAPLPPALPGNWLELSRTIVSPEDAPAVAAAKPRDVRNAFLLRQQSEPAPAGPRRDDWSLVRTSSGKVGWVLASRAILDIPLDIRDQIPNQRITATASLPNRRFLVLTLSQRSVAHQFDTVRLFGWTRARQRYEVLYQDRNVTGYLPFELTPPDAQSKLASFSLVLEDRDTGKCWRRRYSFDGTRVRELAQMEVERPKQPIAADELPTLEIPESVEESRRPPGFWDRLRRRLFGK